MARTVTDVLSRRMRLALYAEDLGRSVAPAVAERMGRLLGWDHRETLRQVEAYERDLDENHPR
jgi:glycerol-3-phosphate dehydrogenase